MNVSGALWSLAVADENKVLMLNAGVVPPLLSLLTLGSVEVHKNVIGTLVSLSQAVENKSIIRTMLGSLLLHASSEIHERVTCLLDSIR